jgi:hypothetical protein
MAETMCRGEYVSRLLRSVRVYNVREVRGRAMMIVCGRGHAMMIVCVSEEAIDDS